jgi:hypothetical protein
VALLFRLSAGLLLLCLACQGPPEDPLDRVADGEDEWAALEADDSFKADAATLPTFTEVNRSHSNTTFRRYVGRALRMLADHDTELGRLTYASIRDGHVRIDELADLTCWDFGRVRRDLPAARLTAADFARLREPRSRAATAINAELAGYMWGNRIYVKRGQSTRDLAATLVHEVNHVINRSEIGYYDDLPTSAFLHEYRAFHAERAFAPDSYEGIDLVDYVITQYELDRARIPARVLEHPLSPRLLPDPAAWRARRVQDDPEEREQDCPADQ